MKLDFKNLEIIFVLITSLAFSILAMAVSDTQDIRVNVTEFSEITVIPSTLNWTQIPVGHAGSEYGGFNNTTIKNSGSVNVSNLYLSIDTLIDESSRPYGTDNATYYAAGGVIVLRNETDTRFYFAGRIEWNWTQDIAFRDWSNVEDADTDVKAWGFFKNTSKEYVWVVGANSTSGRCNDTYSDFAIEDEPDDGTQPTRTPTKTGITYDQGDANYGYFLIGNRLPLNYSCVAVSQDCKKIYIYKFDKSAGLTVCDEASYLHNGNLAPGNTIVLNLDVWIPQGIPYGDLNTSTITITTS